VVLPNDNHLSREPGLQVELRAQLAVAGASVVVMPTRARRAAVKPMKAEKDTARTNTLFPCPRGMPGGYRISDTATPAEAEGAERVWQQLAPAARPTPVGGQADAREMPVLPEAVLRLAATDSALGCARREVQQVVDAWGLEHIGDVVELLASELVRVAMGGPAVAKPCYRDLLHVRSVQLRFQTVAEGLVIATWDEDPRAPRFRQAGTSHHDEGELYFVPMLAEAWDFFRSAGGKVVWAEVAIPPPGRRWLPRRAQLRNGDARLAAEPDFALLERIRDGLLALDRE